MKKALKIGFPIACVAIIGGTFYLLNNMKKDVEVANSNNKNETIVENKIDNSSNETNELSQNIMSDLSIPVPVDNEEKTETKKKENEAKALVLVKQKYGESDTVYFSNEGIDENDDTKYIVAVRSKETTTAKIFYIVNIETEEVEIYY